MIVVGQEDTSLNIRSRSIFCQRPRTHERAKEYTNRPDRVLRHLCSRDRRESLAKVLTAFLEMQYFS